MRILIISDTHRYNSNFDEVLQRIGEPDYLIHCGDISGSELYFENAVKCPVVMINGNNDYCSALNDDEEIDIEGYHIWITHGHRSRVYYGLEWLYEAAAQRGADIVMYGHTHVPSIDYDDDLGIYAVNPGSLSYPRQDGRKPSYMIMEIDREGEVHFTINYL